MPNSIYLLGNDEQLVEMIEQEYDSEDLLQSLLADHPDLLAGEQVNSESPRRWLLVRREAGVPDQQNAGARWAIDHLFLDQDGIPTLVEVKRSRDTRIRREVVGQMLDYAANAVAYWPVESIRSAFEQRCLQDGTDPDRSIAELTENEKETDEFWQNVKTNLRAARIRLVFVADVIPDELRRIIEFLNEQMDPAEVIGLEIRQYVGEGRKTLVPRVIGQTAQAQNRRGGGKRPTPRQWDEASFFEELSARADDVVTQTAHRLLEWGKERCSRIWWGKGAKWGSFFPMFDLGDQSHFTFSAWTYKTIEIQFQNLKNRQPFSSKAMRERLLEKLNAIDGISIPADAIGRRPSIPLEVLAKEDSVKRFLDVMDWYLRRLQQPS